MTVREAVYTFLDSLKEGEYFGLMIIETVQAVTRRKVYSSTVLTYCRDYADCSGATFECVHRKESRYYYKPCCKISGAIID